MEDLPISENQKKYISSLKEYYQHKTQYESDYKKKKKSILNKKDLSITEKLFKIQKIKMSCIQCGEEGGTLFKQENKVLSATCLAANSCDLNINIKLSNTLNLRENINKYDKIVQKLKADVIVTKLSLIFDLEREDIVSQKFNAIKETYKENQKILDVFKNILNDNINFIKIEDPETDELKRMLRSDFIEKNQEILNKHLKNFNERVKLFESDSSKNSLAEALDIYLKNILPLVEYIRQHKYNITYIDVETSIGFNGESLGEKIYINQHTNYISNYYYTHEEGEILKHDVAVVNKRQNKIKRKRKKKQESESSDDSGKEIENIDELFEQDEVMGISELSAEPRSLVEKDETSDVFDKEELSITDASKSVEKPILKKKSDEAKKLSDLDELDEFDPEIDS